jgi:acetyl esterase/lipase
MNDTDATVRPPPGIRLLHALRAEPDWSAMTAADLAAFAAAQNRKRSSVLARVVTGRPDRGADVGWRDVVLPDRTLRVRVHAPARGRTERTTLSLVVHVHGGGFVGTAVQSDWINSHLATRLPAVVVSVEHRLLAPGIPLSSAVDDGWDASCSAAGSAAS